MQINTKPGSPGIHQTEGKEQQAHPGQVISIELEALTILRRGIYAHISGNGVGIGKDVSTQGAGY